MNFKLTIVGAIVFFLVSNIVGMAGGKFIHEGILMDEYQKTSEFWRPELRTGTETEDMAALMPLWLANSFLLSLVVAGIYSCVHGALNGPGWKKGLVWGLSLGIFAAVIARSYAGVFDLPSNIFLWWGIDAIVNFTLAGAVMGWAGAKWGGG